MFITKNKKDYERHVRSKKHQDSSFQPPAVEKDDTTKDNTFQQPPMCPNCNKVYKSRTSIYKHMKQCGVAAASLTTLALPTETSLPPSLPLPLPQSKSLTPEQIQYILIENNILKELLKNAIHGSIM
jgi:uncharacterized C2H2 Zn-finger protein